jgi:hypothetical protein
MTLLCFKCSKKLEPAFIHIEDIVNHPYGGTVFISYGQYGSTVWDPPVSSSHGTFLEINICDECLVKNRQQVIKVVRKNETTSAYFAWSPDEDNI